MAKREKRVANAASYQTIEHRATDLPITIREKRGPHTGFYQTIRFLASPQEWRELCGKPDVLEFGTPVDKTLDRYERDCEARIAAKLGRGWRRHFERLRRFVHARFNEAISAEALKAQIVTFAPQLGDRSLESFAIPEPSLPKPLAARFAQLDDFEKESLYSEVDLLFAIEQLRRAIERVRCVIEHGEIEESDRDMALDELDFAISAAMSVGRLEEIAYVRQFEAKYRKKLNSDKGAAKVNTARRKRTADLTGIWQEMVTAEIDQGATLTVARKRVARATKGTDMQVSDGTLRRVTRNPHKRPRPR